MKSLRDNYSNEPIFKALCITIANINRDREENGENSFIEIVDEEYYCDPYVFDRKHNLKLYITVGVNYASFVFRCAKIGSMLEEINFSDYGTTSYSRGDIQKLRNIYFKISFFDDDEEKFKYVGPIQDTPRCFANWSFDAKDEQRSVYTAILTSLLSLKESLGFWMAKEQYENKND